MVSGQKHYWPLTTGHSFILNLSILDVRTQGKRSFSNLVVFRSAKRAKRKQSMRNIADILAGLSARRELCDDEMRWMMEELVNGRCDDGLAAAFLMGLRVRGETAGEIAVATEVLRRHMIRWNPGRDDVLDTCGTGGDCAGTFNISTATALVLAGIGVPVVKHGNRSASSRSGSADARQPLVSLPRAIPNGPANVSMKRAWPSALRRCFIPLSNMSRRCGGGWVSRRSSTVWVRWRTRLERPANSWASDGPSCWI